MEMPSRSGRREMAKHKEVKKNGVSQASWFMLQGVIILYIYLPIYLCLKSTHLAGLGNGGCT